MRLTMRITKLFAFVAAAALFSVACEPITGGGEEQKPDTTTITLSVDNSVVGIDSAVTFTVMNGEEDVTSECTFYNAATDEVVSNPYTTPMEEGIFEFYATWGFYQSNTVAVEVTTGNNFNHRVLLIDHTGTNCPNCPNMIAMLKALNENSQYHHRCNEAVCHTYNSTDPAYSGDAYTVSSYYSQNIVSFGYPRLFYNFRNTTTTSGHPNTTDGVKNIMAEIDKLWKRAADAGIKATSAINGNQLVVDIEVTSKVEQNYHAVVWVLEDGIYGYQNGARYDWMNTHNNALRRISSGSVSELSGEDMGVIAVDGVASKRITTSLDSSWKKQNLKALIIISAPNKDGKYEVVNTAVCPANGSIDYEYR